MANTVKVGVEFAGRYRVERRLGQGGMGQVWLAHDERLGRDVAIKTLHSDVAEVTDALRLRREARAVAALGHRGIVQVYDIGTSEDGVLFVVMELVEGVSLRQRLLSEGRLPVDDVVRIVRETAEALQAAHDTGLVHRDIKPDNLMQRADGSIVVLDFGLAKALPSRTVDALSPTERELTGTGAMVGTPAYLSPEQARGTDVGPETDQWSLAVTAWELLTGELPWEGDSIAELLVSILEQELPPITENREGVAPYLADQIACALHKDAGERLDRIDELGRKRVSKLAPAPRLPVLAKRKAGWLLALAATSILFVAYGRTPDPSRYVPQASGTGSEREGRFALASGREVTSLTSAWTVQTRRGRYVPLDPTRPLADQGIVPSATMRYRINIGLPIEDIASARRSGLSLIVPQVGRRMYVIAGGVRKPCESEFYPSMCIVDGLDRALDAEGQLELELGVAVPGWRLSRWPEQVHLDPWRRGLPALGPSDTARLLQERDATMLTTSAGHAGWLLLFVFVVVGWRRRELRYLAVAGFLLTANLVAAFHDSAYTWLFPTDPWAASLIARLQFPIHALALLEMVRRVVGHIPVRALRGTQLIVLVGGIWGVADAHPTSWFVVVGTSVLLVTFLSVALIRAHRLGARDAAPLLWMLGFLLLVGVMGLLVGLELTTWFVAFDAVHVAQTLAFCFILARDLFGAQAALEQANRTLERRVEERTAALEGVNIKLTELDQAKTRFFENVSHELRTPLTLVLGPATKMLEDEDLPERTRRPVRLIVRHGRRLLRMVNRMLDLQRLDAHHMHLEVARTDVAALTRRVVDGFEAVAAEKGLSLSVHAPNEVVADVDARRFEDVLFNLLSNAIKHSSAGGRVRVRVLEDGTSRRPVRIEVRDTGEGIPTAQLAHIFERFRRVEGRSAGGTGIGLALVRELVSLHRGTIEVESEEGFGATFTVRLPTARLADLDDAPITGPDRMGLELAALTGPESQVPSQASPGGPVVLVVDDQPDLRQYVRVCLEPEFQVIEAQDGEEALRQLEAGERIAAVVSDVMMPRMDGYELLDRIRTTPSLSGLPVVLLTAKSGSSQRVEGLDAGADDYLPKPFVPAELRARLRNALRVRGELRA